MWHGRHGNASRMLRTIVGKSLPIAPISPESERKSGVFEPHAQELERKTKDDKSTSSGSTTKLSVGSSRLRSGSTLGSSSVTSLRSVVRASMLAVGLYKAKKRPPPTKTEIRAARVIQRSWRRKLFFEEFGETPNQRWFKLTNALKEEWRRDRKDYADSLKVKLSTIHALRKGGPLRPDWRYYKQPAGGVQIADRFSPLQRQVILSLFLNS